MTLTFQREQFKDVYKEAKELVNRNWEEVATDLDTIKLNIDWDSYLNIEDVGMLAVITARDDNDLVGYALHIFNPHAHYKHVIHASQSVIYLSPEHRKGLAGVRLIQASDQILYDIGVTKVIRTTTERRFLGRLLQRLRYKPVETVYERKLR